MALPAHRGLGGQANASAQQQVLVDAIVRTLLYLETVDAWIMEHSTLVNARKTCLRHSLGKSWSSACDRSISGGRRSNSAWV